MACVIVDSHAGNYEVYYPVGSDTGTLLHFYIGVLVN
jgi:hypothetical protein